MPRGESEMTGDGRHEGYVTNVSIRFAVGTGTDLFARSNVPGPPIGVTRLGSPASPRIVPVDAAACRAYRDPGGETALKSYVQRCIEVLGVGFWLVFQKLLGPGSRCVALFYQLTRLVYSKQR